MDLRKYLFENRISITEFARKVRYSRNYLNQVILGHQVPSKKLVEIVEEVTEGKVKMREEK